MREKFKWHKSLEDQIEQALENVNEDRDVTKRLLNDLIDYISVSPMTATSRPAQLRPNMLKHFSDQMNRLSRLQESFRRANANKGPEGLSREEKEDLFELIQGVE